MIIYYCSDNEVSGETEQTETTNAVPENKNKPQEKKSDQGNQSINQSINWLVSQSVSQSI